MVRDDDRLDGASLLSVDDEVFVALADRTRRIVLYVLRVREPLDLGELADVVTGWRSAGGVGMANRADRDRTHAALREEHVPTLVDADLVAYDGARETVGLTSHSAPVRSLIDFAYEFEGGPDAPP